MTASIRRRLAAAALALAVSTPLAACDNPVEHDHEEHVTGLVVLDAGGAEVARVVGATVTGSIALPEVGAETFRVAALGEDGDQLPLADTDLTLRATVADLSVATAAVQTGDRLVVTGLTPGSTTITLDLLHGAHADVSGQVALVVQ